jgi:hypothetical protein
MQSFSFYSSAAARRREDVALAVAVAIELIFDISIDRQPCWPPLPLPLLYSLLFHSLQFFISKPSEGLGSGGQKKGGGMSLSSLLTSFVDVVVVEEEKGPKREKHLLFCTLFFLFPQTINLHQSYSCYVTISSSSFALHPN